MPDSEARIITGWYKQLADRARAEILNPGGGTETSQAFNQARASSRISQLKDLAKQIDANAAKWIGRRMPAVYREGRSMADQQAVEAGVRPPGGALGGDFNLVDSGSLKVLARDTMVDLQKASGGIVKTADRVLRATAENGLSTADINTILAGGIVEGKPRETIVRLRDELQRVHKGNVVTITSRSGEPMQFDAEHYAELVVRTKTREAMVKSRLDRFDELGLDLVSITGRLSNNFCSAYLNQVFSISGKHPKYPPLASLPGGGPPFHPNCSKSIRPFVEELASSDQLKTAEPDGDVSKLLGVNNNKAQRLYQDLNLAKKTQARIEKVVPLSKDILTAEGKGSAGGSDWLTPEGRARRKEESDKINAAIARGERPAPPPNEESDLVTVVTGTRQPGETIPRPPSDKQPPAKNERSSPHATTDDLKAVEQNWKVQASKMSTAKLKASLRDHETNSSNPDHPVAQIKVSVLMGELEARGVKIIDRRNKPGAGK